MTDATTPPAEGSSPATPAQLPDAPAGRAWVPFALAALSGTLHFLSFCGFGVWPLAFVCFLPLFLALEVPGE